MSKKCPHPISGADSCFVRPNWRDSTAYKWIESASLSAIAWEFLRRNSDYAAQCNTYQTDINADDDADGSVYVATWITADGVEASEWTTKQDRLDALAREHGSLQAKPLSVFLGAEWGLKSMVETGTGYESMRVQFVDSGGRFSMLPTKLFNSDESMTVRGTKGTPIRHFAIDLSLPLSVLDANLRLAVRWQRAAAVKAGDVIANNSRAVRKALYVQYLRILDGLSEGKTPKEAGAVIAPGGVNDARIRERDKRFNAAANEAKRLMNGGYKVLPLLEPIKRKSKGKK